MPINYPKVHPTDVQNFAKVWNCNGIKMILDDVSLRFAVDYANTVLRSYVVDLMEKSAAAKKAKQAPGTPDAAPAPEPPKKSSIILTD